MSVADQHAVPATLAAFISQLDIALAWLSDGDVHAAVGVETLDDVARIEAGESTLGQAKISFSRNPITDQSRNLWNTLKTWLDLVDAGECELNHSRFLLISNFLATGIVASIKAADGDRAKVASFVRDLRNRTKTFKGPCKPFVDEVVGRSDNDLIGLFCRIQIADEQPISPSDQLAALQGKLNLTDDIAADVIRGLRGWVVEKVQEKLARKEPAWLERQHFCDELYQLIERYRNRTLYLRSIRDFVINEEDRQLHTDATFVRQLQLIGIDDGSDEILDAINDFLMSASERTRLSADTNITRNEFESFEDRLIERWKPLHRQCRRNAQDPVASGYATYCKIQDHREPLDGHATDEYYFTRGTYHELANGTKSSKPKLGWHPDFDKLV